MPAYPGRAIDSTPGWRVGLLLLAFVVVAVLVDHFTAFIERVLAKRHGLLEATRKLKKEIFQLGVVSLLLIAVQESLGRICIESSGKSEKYYRRSLAASGVSSNYCSDGQEPFWTSETIFQTHVLLFVTASVHVCYTTVTMLLCMWKVNSWHRFEEAARTASVVSVSSRIHDRLGGNKVTHLFHVLVDQFLPHAISLPVYGNVRLLFIERMHVSLQFNFHAFLTESMEEQLGLCMEVEWSMWGMVVLLLAVPRSWFGIYVFAGLSLLVTLVVSVKLGSVAVYLAAMASFKYSDGALLDRLEAADPMELTHKLTLARTSLVPRPSLSPSTDSPHYVAPGGHRPFTPCPDWPQYASPGGAPKLQPQEGPATEPGSPAAPAKVVCCALPVCLQAQGSPASPQPAASSSMAVLARPSMSQQRLAEQRRRVQKVPDAASLFWFGRPLLVLKMFQLVFFANSMSIALLIFAAWQDTSSNWIFQNISWHWLTLLMAIDILVMVHSALMVLPTYALIEPVGSHCPNSILTMALKTGVRPEETSTLVHHHLSPPQPPPRSPPRGGGLLPRNVEAVVASASSMLGLRRSVHSASDLVGLAAARREDAAGAGAATDDSAQQDQNQGSLHALIDDMYQVALQKARAAETAVGGPAATASASSFTSLQGAASAPLARVSASAALSRSSPARRNEALPTCSVGSRSPYMATQPQPGSSGTPQAVSPARPRRAGLSPPPRPRPSSAAATTQALPQQPLLVQPLPSLPHLRLRSSTPSPSSLSPGALSISGVPGRQAVPPPSPPSPSLKTAISNPAANAAAPYTPSTALPTTSLPTTATITLASSSKVAPHAMPSTSSRHRPSTGSYLISPPAFAAAPPVASTSSPTLQSFVSSRRASFDSRKLPPSPSRSATPPFFSTTGRGAVDGGRFTRMSLDSVRELFALAQLAGGFKGEGGGSGRKENVGGEAGSDTLRIKAGPGFGGRRVGQARASGSGGHRDEVYAPRPVLGAVAGAGNGSMGIAVANAGAADAVALAGDASAAAPGRIRVVVEK